METIIGGNSSHCPCLAPPPTPQCWEPREGGVLIVFHSLKQLVWLNQSPISSNSSKLPSKQSIYDTTIITNTMLYFYLFRSFILAQHGPDICSSVTHKKINYWMKITFLHQHPGFFFIVLLFSLFLDKFIFFTFTNILALQGLIDCQGLESLT